MSGGESTVGGDRPETKKKKKKGWKGWALVVEDEDGNLIDVKEDKALPANAVELTGEKSRGELRSMKPLAQEIRENMD